MTEYGDIYLMRSKGDNIPYVGITTNYNTRVMWHKRQIDLQKHNTKLNRYCGKYDKKSYDFSFSILEKSVSLVSIGKKEKYWIMYYDSYNNGFNCTLGDDHKLSNQWGEKSSSSKLTRNQCLEIIKKYLSGNYTCEILSKEYNVAFQTIHRILTGETWKWLIDDETRNLIRLIVNTKRSNTAKNNGENIYNPVFYNGKWYKNCAYAAKDNNVKRDTLLKRIRSGHMSDDTVKTGSRKKYPVKSVLYENNIYTSIRKCAKEIGVSHSTIRYWLKTGKAQYID